LFSPLTAVFNAAFDPKRTSSRVFTVMHNTAFMDSAKWLFESEEDGLAVCTNQPSGSYRAGFMRRCRGNDTSVCCSISKFRQLGLWGGLEL
jgi:hypothetical protein